MWTNSHNRWGKVSIFLHWGMGLLIIGMLGVGLYMVNLPPSDTKWMLYDLHKSFGALLLILALSRLIWRISQPIPHLPDLPKVHIILAKTSPWILYLMMLIMPISGYVMSTAAGFPVGVFGLWTLPNFIPHDPTIASWAQQVHHLAGRLFIIVLLLHVSAALYHHWVRKNFLLKRMLGKAE